MSCWEKVNGASVNDRTWASGKIGTNHTGFLLVNAGPTLALFVSLIKQNSLQWNFTSTKCLEIQTPCIFCGTGADHNLIFLLLWNCNLLSDVSPVEQSSAGLGSLEGANGSRGPRWKSRRAAPWLPFFRGKLYEGESKSRKTDLKNQSRKVLRPIVSSFPNLIDGGCLEILL